MFEAVSAHLLRTHITDFKSRINRDVILSNYYNTVLEEKDWLLNIQPCGLFFIGCDALTGLNHYFFVVESKYLSDAKITLPEGEKLISEFVFNSQASDLVLKHFKNIGFNVYAHLMKMSLVKKYNVSRSSSLIIHCCIDDFGYLRRVFDNKFDRISERYPSDDELISAINEGSLFKFVEKGCIFGFYWSDTKKFLSELRYIFVEETTRGLGIGRALLEHHLFTTQSVKKNQLWVLSNNTAAIALYENFGYSFEGLQDFIFLKD
jgi:GNAT superfamily N-acetyltransferase